MSRPRIVLSINSCWNFVNFRAGLVRAFVENGYEVVAAAPTDRHASAIKDLGARHVPIAMDGRGTSPIQDAKLFLDYLALLRRERPAAFIGYTIKPNIYGSIAARILGIPSINNVAGLGTAFLEHGLLNRFVRTMYRVGLGGAKVVFFQNPDDRNDFLDTKIIEPKVAKLLPGSGVDINRFRPIEAHAPARDASFLLVARMLWAKGIGDYVEAAQYVKDLYPKTRFFILGIMGSGQGAIDAESITTWQKKGIIEYLGSADDVRPHMAAADCIVLPTFYPEGTPRSLLEAASMGKPLIATDVAGCRQIVDPCLNGFLVPPRNPRVLADAMIRIIEISASGRRRMGLASREKAIREFDERIVIDAYLRVLEDVRSRAVVDG